MSLVFGNVWLGTMRTISAVLRLLFWYSYWPRPISVWKHCNIANMLILCIEIGWVDSNIVSHTQLLRPTRNQSSINRSIDRSINQSINQSVVVCHHKSWRRTDAILSRLSRWWCMISDRVMLVTLWPEKRNRG